MQLEFEGLVRIPVRHRHLPSRSGREKPPPTSSSGENVANILFFHLFLQNTALKDLLALSRRIKELWVFGPLASHDATTRQKAGDLERDVLKVAALMNDLEEGAMKSLAEGHGGVWKEKPREARSG